MMNKCQLPTEFIWAKELNCGITICDCSGVITYMNDKAMIQKHGNLIGKNIFDCHNPNSCTIIRRLLATGGENIYTIEKNGVKKLIYQSAWRTDGAVSGLCEIIAEFSGTIPHYIR